MKKVLFLIHDLSHGGAEKVLVNLVNNMDNTKFDVTVMALFDVGVNKQFLNSNIKYKYVFKKIFPGNSKIFKLLTPKQLHKLFIKEKYDIEAAYLEGPCSRIISGCPDKNTKLVSWIHTELHTPEKASASFKSINEAEFCYNQFDKIIGVSNTVKEDFERIFNLNNSMEVLYNTNESQQIMEKSRENIDFPIKNDCINLVGVGKLLKVKGFDRLAKIIKKLCNEGYNLHLYILGVGPEKDALEHYIKENNLENNLTLLGYQTNPYKYVSKCDLFVCASHAEGFSTAATEALIVGTPVCTVEVSGMREMLGENNEYGIVCENSDEALYLAIKDLLDNPGKLAHYKKQAEIRGKDFSTEKTVKAAENMLEFL